MTYPLNDTQFREGAVASFNNDAFTCEDGWSLGVPKEFVPKPKQGDTYRMYGKGIGYTVRGLFFNGRQVFYRTEKTQGTKNRLELEASERKQRAEFESGKADMDSRVAALPWIFQQRIEKFRRNNPEFRWKYESYELFVCEEAVLIADELETPEAVQEFSSLPYEEQRERVAFSSGHSGNTFGAACRLAYLSLADESAVEQMHGALAPLVGSEEYGCVPTK